jgi:hypothetical protein
MISALFEKVGMPLPPFRPRPELRDSCLYVKTASYEEHFADDKQLNMRDMNDDYLWMNKKEGAPDIAKDLLPGGYEFEEGEEEWLIEQLMSVETDIGEDYDTVFLYAYEEAISATGADFSENSDADVDWGYSSILEDPVWEQIYGKAGVPADEMGVISMIMSKDTSYTNNGVFIDLNQGKSPVAQAIRRQSRRADWGKKDSDFGHYIKDDLKRMADTMAETMVKYQAVHLFGDRHHDRGAVENRFFDFSWRRRRVFLSKWEPKVLDMLKLREVGGDEVHAPLEGEGEQMEAKQRTGVVKTAQGEPAMARATYLGGEEDEAYFLKINENEVIYGEVISDDDLESKTLEYWFRFFDDNPSEIQGLVDRGFLPEVENDLLEGLIEDGDQYTTEETVYRVEDLDNNYDSREEAIEAISEEAQLDSESPEAANTRIKELIETIEERTVYTNEMLSDEQFDDEDEIRLKLGELYKSDLSSYMSPTDLGGYARRAAEVVVESDGAGHGLDVEEIEVDGETAWLSVRGMSEVDYVLRDKNSYPDEVIDNLNALLMGAKPGDVVEEPLERGEA